jgi:hypothetical protein
MKLPTDKAEASKAAAFAAAGTTTRERGDAQGEVQEVQLGQDGIEVPDEEEEDDEITEWAKYLKKLEQYQQDILSL